MSFFYKVEESWWQWGKEPLNCRVHIRINFRKEFPWILRIWKSIPLKSVCAPVPLGTSSQMPWQGDLNLKTPVYEKNSGLEVTRPSFVLSFVSVTLAMESDAKERESTFSEFLPHARHWQDASHVIHSPHKATIWGGCDDPFLNGKTEGQEMKAMQLGNNESRILSQFWL